jgi:hypothetical protein
MAKKTPAKKATVRTRGGKPRTAALPGMEDHAIKPLEDVAEAYAEIRDERMQLTQREHDLKGNALKLMHKFGKTIYRHNGVEITVVPGEEDVKVRVKKGGDEDDEEAPAAGARFGSATQTEERRRAVDGDTGE